MTTISTTQHHPQGTRKRIRSLALHLAVLAISTLSVFVPVSASPAELPAESIPHWQELQRIFGDRISFAKGLQHFDEHLSTTVIEDVTPDAFSDALSHQQRAQISTTLFDLAFAMYQEDDPRSEKFYEQAFDYEERIQKAGLGASNAQPYWAALNFAQSVARVGGYDLALATLARVEPLQDKYGKGSKVAQRTPGLARISNLAKTRTRQLIAESVGDLAEIEAMQRERIASFKGLLSGTEAAAMPAIAKAPVYMLYPELAAVLAQQGKISEAREVMDEYNDFFANNSQASAMLDRIANASPGGPMVKFYPLARASLYLGEPEQALAHIESAKADASATKNVEISDAERSMLERNRKLGILEIQIPALWELKRFAELREAVEGYRQTRDDLADHDPNIMAMRKLRLWAALADGDRSYLENNIESYATDQKKMIESVFRFAPERQRLSLLQSIDPFSLMIAADRPDLFLPAIVQLKGVVLDSVLEDGRTLASAPTPEIQSLQKRLAIARRQMDHHSMAGSKEEIEATRSRILLLEAELRAKSGGKAESRTALAVTLEEIQDRLQPGQAVVEYIRYNAMTEPGVTEAHYGAAVFQKSLPPAWIPLGACSQINRGIAEFAALMAPVSGSFDDDGTRDTLETLDRQLIQPIVPSLDGLDTILISPDGALSGLSFAVLLDANGSFLCERWKIGFVSSSRDLLRAESLPADGGSIAILADPDFARSRTTDAEKGRLASRSVTFDTATLPELSPLPGTRREMEIIDRKASEIGFQVDTFAAEKAEESVVSGWQTSPDILHFATHGLILPPSGAVSLHAGEHEASIDSASRVSLHGSTSAGSADNALRRSMLALAGANATFSEWAKGNAPDSASDGLLSAAEVATLPLGNTSLAVLSACDTGSGQALSGEGVFGLRRGFLTAGVDHLMMTFWPIADEQTVEVMAEFYDSALSGTHPVDALQRAQRSALQKWRNEFGLGAAVYLAGPFAMSTSGPLSP